MYKENSFKNNLQIEWIHSSVQFPVDNCPSEIPARHKMLQSQGNVDINRITGSVMMLFKKKTKNTHTHITRSQTDHKTINFFPHRKTKCISLKSEDCLCQFSPLVVSNSLWPHGLQHTRLPCPSSTPGACSNSCPSSQCCHPTISSSVVPFSSCLQSFPASGSFPMGQFFASGGQSIYAR